jgi:hypothetical protein
VAGLQIRVPNRGAFVTWNHHRAPGWELRICSLARAREPAQMHHKPNSVRRRQVLSLACRSTRGRAASGRSPEVARPHMHHARPRVARPSTVRYQPTPTRHRVNAKHAASGLRAAHNPENNPAPFYGAFEYNRHSLVTRRESVTA